MPTVFVRTRPAAIIVTDGPARPVIVVGDLAVSFDELDKPRTEGQLRVRALNPQLVWLAHQHEPWRPHSVEGCR